MWAEDDPAYGLVASTAHAPSPLTSQSSPVKSLHSNPSKNVSANGTTYTSSMYAAPTWPDAGRGS